MVEEEAIGELREGDIEGEDDSVAVEDEDVEGWAWYVVADMICDDRDEVWKTSDARIDMIVDGDRNWWYMKR